MTSLEMYFNIIVIYEKHDVNTPSFMAGMKRHPLKTV